MGAYSLQPGPLPDACDMACVTLLLHAFPAHVSARLIECDSSQLGEAEKSGDAKHLVRLEGHPDDMEDVFRYRAGV